MTTENPYPWADGMDCAVTVCDTGGTILYMNDKARTTFARHGDMVGKNLFDCHGERSREIIRRLLADGGTNVYTIEKNGVRKMIYQTAWRVDGVVGGLAEISMEIPAEMPHYTRKGEAPGVQGFPEPCYDSGIPNLGFRFPDYASVSGIPHAASIPYPIPGVQGVRAREFGIRTEPPCAIPPR